jgi:hypothetical protein
VRTVPPALSILLTTLAKLHLSAPWTVALSLSLIPNQANEFPLLLHSSGHPHLLLLVLLSFSLVLPG